MGKLDGKTTVITGGASGIGKATVKLFKEEGANVIFGDVLDDRGESLAKELGKNAIFKHTDVAKEEDVQALISQAKEKFGRLDCVYNNAAFGGAGGMIDAIPAIGFDVTVAVNLRSVFFGMKYAAAIMKEQKSGNIISAASIAGHRTGFGGHIYSACKAAIIQMTRTVAIELGPFNIRVNCICPGAVVTSIFGRTFGQDQDTTESGYEGIAEIFKDLQSIPRPCMPEDIAKAILWLASDESSYVNGTAINVDGGIPDGLTGVEIPTAEKP
ncbi:MAG: glucose 1-dehydrogenase [Deltaproteobacteria bacterium]|nr:glucose 1-dehydrogenase [Deltaproteobacteria bacterium]